MQTTVYIKYLKMIIFIKRILFLVSQIDVTVIDTTTTDQSGFVSNGNEEVLYISLTARLETHHQIQFSFVPRTLKVCLSQFNRLSGTVFKHF